VSVVNQETVPMEALEEDIKRKVQDFILSHILPGESRDNLKTALPLRTSGILDSISTLRLIQFVEAQFDLEVSITDANTSNFNSIDSIAAYVIAKKANT